MVGSLVRVNRAYQGFVIEPRRQTVSGLLLADGENGDAMDLQPWPD